jgi:hypothetical protein
MMRRFQNMLPSSIQLATIHQVPGPRRRAACLLHPRLPLRAYHRPVPARRLGREPVHVSQLRVLLL